VGSFLGIAGGELTESTLSGQNLPLFFWSPAHPRPARRGPRHHRDRWRRDHDRRTETASFGARLLVRAALALSLAGIGAPVARAADVLAPTPPMGWNSWNKFGCQVSEKRIREAADTLVSSGMKAAGYSYVVIDDCWQTGRDARGTIVADPQRFPSGMKSLADAIHAKGLKFGIYSDAGTLTCAKRPGSKDHEAEDAATYAAWGVDYLKYDWCNTDGQDARAAYPKMSRALRATGRPIVFSICEWGTTKPWLWAAGVGQLWRATGDIQDCWDCGRSWGGMGVVHIIDLMADLYPYTGPDHFNDPDMLEVGNGGLTLEESRSHFSFWALFAAPLMAGNDLTAMTPEIRDILLNREVIAVDQDALGIQGRKVRDDGAHEVWMKPLGDGSRAVILFNRGSEAAAIGASWEEIGLAPSARALVRDLWRHADAATAAGRYEARVAPHGVVMVRITAQ
jgi:alpha-galactosidase